MPPLACPNPSPQAPAVPQKKHAPAYLPKPATANKRRSAKEACSRLLAQTRHRKQAPLRKRSTALQLTHTCNRKHPPPSKRSMPPLTCPQLPPPTSAALQKQHAPACLPKPATANKHLSAKEASPRQLTHTGHRKHAPLRKRSMPPQTHPNPPPPTRASPQKQHATANSPTPATASTRRSAKEACPRLLAQTRHR